MRMRLLAGLAGIGVLSFAACGGGGGTSGAMPPVSQGPAGGGGATPTPTPTPTSTISSLSTIICRSGISAQSISQSSAAESAFTRMPPTFGGSQNSYVPGVIEVSYRSATLEANRTEASDAIQRAGGQVRNELDASATDERIQIVSVPYGDEDSAIQQLKSNPLVKSVTRSAARYIQSTNASFTNDPFFNGFSPNNTPPFYEASNSSGQWDMHVICAADAWGYGNANTTGRTFPGALGGNVRLAIIDTGADLTHPELQNRVVYAETDLNGSVTVGTATMHDNDGHGTNVAGIAAATGNNGLGFDGVAYAAPLMIFKVFPDPPSGGCSPGSTNPQCVSSGADIATAILDAVNNGAKVINLSLGANGPDTAEENAVATAIARGVVIVAASGNDSAATLDYPAADPGVIAVGASSIDDSNPSAPVESVASYSNYSAVNPTWGLVAPGGDPNGSGDMDDLHWIENIYSSTAVQPGLCVPDPRSTNGIIDCRTLIAGTSQATPHVTGAVALLLSVNSALTPATVKTTLCTTARAITNPKSGCGRLDVYRAMAQAVGDPSP